MSETMQEGLAVRAGRVFESYRDGNPAAMAELVRMLTPILWHTVRATRLDTATAEDVIQTSWLTLVRRADTITEPRAVLQWLIVSARREAWRVSRQQSRVRVEDPDREQTEVVITPDAFDTVAAEVLDAGEAQQLWHHIQTLPPRCQTLLRVIAFADRPDYAELSRALGMPQGSIGPTRGRCLAKLRLALANDPSWEDR